MSSTKGRVFRLLSSMLLKRVSVVEAQAVGGFRRLRLGGDVPTFTAGMKVQLLLPSNDTRTYTPVPSPEGMLLLGWQHAGGPGARWMAGVGKGDELLFLGPQRSLELMPGSVLLVGDETSVAVAASIEADRAGQVHTLIQTDVADDVRAAAASVGLRQVGVVARGDHQTTADVIAAKVSEAPDTAVVLTGCSELVVAVRGLLRAVGIGNVKTKAYWIPGKVGLD